MSKLSARWVLRMLTADQKLARFGTSRTLLTHFQTDQANFFRQFVTQDKTWVPHFEPEPKLLSKQRETPWFLTSQDIQAACHSQEGHDLCFLEQ
jgi:hypothetical protein